MEYIMPIIVVISLIASVMDAVKKSMNTPQEKKTLSPDFQSLEPVSEPNVIKETLIESQETTITDLGEEVYKSSLKDEKRERYNDHSYELEIPRTSFDEDLLEERALDSGVRNTLNRKETSELALHPAVSDQKNVKAKMREIVVLSEILREPRSIRPWPNR